MKIVKAVKPYIFPHQINFKHKPYDAWRELGGNTAFSHYPLRIFHKFAYSFEIPTISHFTSKKEARLRFVQPWSISFDTFPDYLLYEIIPFIWDCWPDNLEHTIKWLQKYNVQTAIFTSSQVAEGMKKRFPSMNILSVTEGIDANSYYSGKELECRDIDFFEYGREIDNVVKYDTPESFTYFHGKKNGKTLLTHPQLYDTLANSKMVACYPKSWTNPESAQGIETLTQRYWECMLSRCIMVGHAPKELVELLGYNPVIALDRSAPNEQLLHIKAHISDFQDLVNKNRNAALKYGDWKYSIQKVMHFLKECGYTLK